MTYLVELRENIFDDIDADYIDTVGTFGYVRIDGRLSIDYIINEYGEYAKNRFGEYWCIAKGNGISELKPIWSTTQSIKRIKLC